MSRRGGGRDEKETGANTIPLGSSARGPRKAITGGSLLKPSYLTGSQSPPSAKASRSRSRTPPKRRGPRTPPRRRTPSPPFVNPIQNYDFPNMRNPNMPNMPYRPPGMPNMVVPHGYDHSSRKRSSDSEDRESRPKDKDKMTREERKKARKSRWTDEASKTFIPGLPTLIPAGLSKQQEEIYLLQLKIEEASRRLRSNDLGIPWDPADRSPSPEPIYSGNGQRLNTREYRKRRALEDVRHEGILAMKKINPDYQEPPDYKAPQIKVSDKVMIPQEDHPHIKFIGLLIGPRGNTLRQMESESGGAKIVIRGKGSVAAGKVGPPLPGQDEPLHAYITATDPNVVEKAVKKIKSIIQQAVEGGDNIELKNKQLRELALLNGTLREDYNTSCTNCGATDHKSWQCQDKANVTNNVTCTACGAVGHPASDCKQKRPGTGFGYQYGEAPGAGRKIDQEYDAFMAQLGDKPGPGGPPLPGGTGGPPGFGQTRPGGFGQPPRAPLPLMGPAKPPAPRSEIEDQFNSFMSELEDGSAPQSAGRSATRGPGILVGGQGGTGGPGGGRGRGAPPPGPWNQPGSMPGFPPGWTPPGGRGGPDNGGGWGPPGGRGGTGNGGWGPPPPPGGRGGHGNGGAGWGPPGGMPPWGGQPGPVPAPPGFGKQGTKPKPDLSKILGAPPPPPPPS